jgi:hypothetical protein
MRFHTSANWFPISDGPHRIDQTASGPVQIRLTLPAVDVARTSWTLNRLARKSLQTGRRKYHRSP